MVSPFYHDFYHDLPTRKLPGYIGQTGNFVFPLPVMRKNVYSTTVIATRTGADPRTAIAFPPAALIR
jgi:hypothetical protein